METRSEHRCFGGTLGYYRHKASSTACGMNFTVFVPESASPEKPAPVVTFLSGLTCTEDNFTVKSGAYRTAAELGLVIVSPDTSPRGEEVADAEGYDIGKGAGFYINATQEPWAKHYQMERYITQELHALIAQQFPVDPQRQGIMGHSMGGHGALTLFFKYPHLYRSVSAFAPIVTPATVPWGEKAFSHYLGNNREEWKKHDASELVKQASAEVHARPILIDQGTSDKFLGENLQPELFEAACKASRQKLILRHQQGYDHSYFFIQSFMEDHLKHHCQMLSDHAYQMDSAEEIMREDQDILKKLAE